MALPALAAGPYINSCDVVTINGKYILRDFFENGVTPAIGKDTSPLLQLLKEDPVARTGVSVKLLAHKLQDLEQVHAQLPYFIFLTIHHHQWFVQDRNFDRLPDSSPIIDVTSEQCHSLVARQGSQVYFNKPIWQRLDTEQQVAVVLRQAFLSLLKPELFSASSMPPETPVREIIAELFKKNLRIPSIRDALHRYFQIPIRPFLDDNCSPSNFVPGSVHTFNFINYAEPNSISIAVSADRNFYSPILLEFEERIERPEKKKDKLGQAVKNACTAMLASEGQIVIEASRLPGKLSEQQVPIRYGTHFSLSIQALHGILNFQAYDYPTVEECSSSLLKLVNSWIDGEDFTPSPDNDAICYNQATSLDDAAAATEAGDAAALPLAKK
ncbi:hypothetical protein AZI86_10780 [Bdellovibrio bacteriovorus]|uniref:Uncharacterized protein n=1 Tax=Bdellovibrio bacteriovorus TaxID=959 RepID=A0A150WL82_BDEBC|nr:hypothetical protein [Bdellovibrio bacteriovorus]KYG64688.1 hypothetical protein AZI86_10780 [Bdellovibrio bacteriovorus]